jgi:TPR repeat protein
MARKSKPRAARATLSAQPDASDAFEQAHILLADGVEADYPAAMNCLRIAAEQGHAQACNDLATMLRDGLGCAPDIGEAIHWYRLSAAQDEPAAQYNLGLIYLHGIGVEADKALAAEYLLQAANAGDAAAMRELGTMLRLGDGIDKDIVVAAWLHLGAAEDGDVAAIEELAAYFRELVPPALDGNVHAARALYRVYRDGLGHEANAAQAWAWIRRAHDICLHDCGGPADEDANAVREDYEQALHAIGPADRKAGDACLEALLRERNAPPRSQAEPM